MKHWSIKNKTLAVFAITLATMILEVFFGIASNSMSLTADGLHMGAHVLVFGITYAVCVLAEKNHEKAGKINTIGGKTNAVLLLLSAFPIIYESIEHLFARPDIVFSDAILVAAVGLAANAFCMFFMHDGGRAHRDNLNYKSAYFHILSDMMTSVLAIAALLGGKYFGLVFLDGAMGIIGGLVILKWSLDLLGGRRSETCHCGHCHCNA